MNMSILSQIIEGFIATGAIEEVNATICDDRGRIELSE